MPAVAVICDGEMVAPFVEGLSVLRPAGQGLQLVGIRPKPHAKHPHLEPRILTVRKTDVASRIAKRVFEDHRIDGALVSKVDPIIRTIKRAVHHVLRIGEGKAGEHFVADVGLAIAVGVFEEPHIRSRRDKDASFPAHHAVGHDEVVGEHGAPIRYTISVRIL